VIAEPEGAAVKTFEQWQAIVEGEIAAAQAAPAALVDMTVTPQFIA
jgi:hypothetical protein